MILGYVVRGHDNGARFFQEEKAEILCERCGSCRNYRYCPEVIDMDISKKYDVSVTYDGRMLFSDSFMRFCKDSLSSEEEFTAIKVNETYLYYMFPSVTLTFDTERRGSRLGRVCEECGEYESVVGALPAILKESQPMGPGFFRSDLAFGSGREKFPLIMVGSKWKELLAARRFRGLEFREALGIPAS